MPDIERQRQALEELWELEDQLPELGQRVSVSIRGARDLPPREGTVVELEDGEAYVTNLDDFVGVRPGNMFGQWVSTGAWDLEDEDQVFEVRVVAPSSTT